MCNAVNEKRMKKAFTDDYPVTFPVKYNAVFAFYESPKKPANDTKQPRSPLPNVIFPSQHQNPSAFSCHVRNILWEDKSVISLRFFLICFLLSFASTSCSIPISIISRKALVGKLSLLSFLFLISAFLRKQSGVYKVFAFQCFSFRFVHFNICFHVALYLPLCLEQWVQFLVSLFLYSFPFSLPFYKVLCYGYTYIVFFSLMYKGIRIEGKICYGKP